MDPVRPFSGPVSVSLAALTIAGLAAWSFGSGLSRELRLAHADVPPGHVVVLSPKPPASPPGAADLAYMAPLPTEAAPPAHRPRHRAHADAVAPVLPDIPPAAPGAPATPAAADVAGADAAAIVATPPEDPAADASNATAP